MIYCSNCGTANRDGSKFCNECGERLKVMNDILCSQCGQSNEPAHAFCIHCGARLTPPASSTEPAARPAPPTDVEAPSWLQQLRAAAQRETEWAAAKDAEEPADVAEPLTAEESEATTAPTLEADESRRESAPADLLARLRSAARPTSPASRPPGILAPEEPDAGLPDWLVGQPPTPVPTPPQEPEAAEVPDWLAQLRRQAVEHPSATSALIEEETRLPVEPKTELPALLLEPEETPAGPAVGEASRPPAWLAEIVGAPMAISPEPMAPESLAPQPFVTEEFSPIQPEMGGAPDWLRELGPAPHWEMSAAEQPQGSTARELPDWLKADQMAESGAPIGEMPAETEGGLTRANIPDWLQALRPGAQERPAETGPLPTSEPGTAGVLQGLPSVIPIELSVARPPETVEIGAMLTAIPAEDEASRAFAEALQPAGSAPVAPAPPRSLAPLWRIILALLLVLAVSVPLIAGDAGLWVTSRSSSADQGRLTAIHSRLETLGENAPVLVAFDFDATTADELRPLAEALVAHLMRKHARIIAVSLLPGGAPIASQILTEMAAEEAGQAGAPSYFNLGYLPGQQAALRELVVQPFHPQSLDFGSGQAWSESPVTQDLRQLQDLDLILVLSASQDDVRWWIEQVRLESKVPMYAGVSAAVMPYVNPYAQGPQASLDGLLAGLSDAAAYSRLMGAGTNIAQQMEALSWAAGLALLVICASLLIAPLIERERRR